MRLPLERLFTEPPITGPEMSGIRWPPDGTRFTYLISPEDEKPELWSYDLETGQRVLLATEAALKEADGEIRLAGYQWLPSHGSLLLKAGGKAWLVEPGSTQPERILENIDDQVTPHPSPDGSHLAFIREGNLWIRSMAECSERALTSDGGGPILNGKLDWVYWEELSNRKGYRAFEWSPDGQRIAYIRLDQTRVPEFPLIDARETHAKMILQRYPKAGDPNSTPSVHTASIADGSLIASEELADDAAYVGPELAWTPDGAGVAWTWLSRDQRRLELRLLTPVPDRQALLTEEDPFWLNHIGPPFFLPDGRFLWVSERDGHAHLYLYAESGDLLHRLTEGPWQVEQILGVYEGWAYFTGSGFDARTRRLYRLSVEDRTLQILTPDEAFVQVEWQERGAWSVVTLHTPEAPPELRLLRPNGTVQSTVWTLTSEWRECDWASSEYADVTAEDGTVLHGRLLRPHNFDPSRKYPVVVHVYGGPHAQTVRHTWEGSDPLEQLLVQEGILVWRLDNRGSWGRGHAFETPVNREMYCQELADQLEGVRYLKSLPYVDPDRIGITGWSYGGSMTLYSLTRAPEVWRCGAAGAPVTDWVLYDTIYTERYMGTPQENPDGYRACSILEGAPNLRAPLLLMHGTDDDNVHLQNTLQFVDRLSQHRKPYELLIQPGQKHGFHGASARTYQHERLVEFLVRHLTVQLPDSPQGET